jgi:hypothetical protein
MRTDETIPNEYISTVESIMRLPGSAKELSGLGFNPQIDPQPPQDRPLWMGAGGLKRAQSSASSLRQIHEQSEENRGPHAS